MNIKILQSTRCSDVKRGQILEAKAEAEDKSLRPRPRTIFCVHW